MLQAVATDFMQQNLEVMVANGSSGLAGPSACAGRVQIPASEIPALGLKARSHGYLPENHEEASRPTHLGDPHRQRHRHFEVGPVVRAMKTELARGPNREDALPGCAILELRVLHETAGDQKAVGRCHPNRALSSVEASFCLRVVLVLLRGQSEDPG